MITECFIRISADNGPVVMNANFKAYSVGIAFPENPISEIGILTAKFVIGIKTPHVQGHTFSNHAVAGGQICAIFQLMLRSWHPFLKSRHDFCRKNPAVFQWPDPLCHDKLESPPQFSDVGVFRHDFDHFLQNVLFRQEPHRCPEKAQNPLCCLNAKVSQMGRSKTAGAGQSPEHGYNWLSKIYGIIFAAIINNQNFNGHKTLCQDRINTPAKILPSVVGWNYD
jgi:hypothetical protein